MALKVHSHEEQSYSRRLFDEPFRRSVVWTCWVLLFSAMLGVCLKFHLNIPYSEDWFLVAPFTGNEPHLGQWLWSLHNDHRTPLPKLVMLGILKLTHGDFRAVAVFNVASLAILSAGFIALARQQRGRTMFSDVFFPLVFLHPGNVENMLWPWQITFITSIAFVCLVLMVLIDINLLARPRGAVIFGVSTVLLPLTGATGLLFAVPMSLFGVYMCRSVLRQRSWNRYAGIIYGLSAIATVSTVVVYFVGYTHSALAASNTNPVFLAWAFAQVLALGFGPATRSLSFLSVTGVLCLVALTMSTAISRLRYLEGAYRLRLAGLLAVIVTGSLYALALGRGRAVMAYTLYGGWPQRFCLLIAPVLIAVYFTWDFCRAGRLHSLVQPTLAGILVVLLPLNTALGLSWITLYRQRTRPLLSDLAANLQIRLIAERNGNRVFFAPEELERLIPMLKKARVPPFVNGATPTSSAVATNRQVPTLVESDDLRIATLRKPHFTREVRYVMPQAGEVLLVWGIDGWWPVPADMRPPNTEIVDGRMNTPMDLQGNHFTAQVEIPEGSRIDYGFLIRKSRDGRPVQLGFEAVPARPGLHISDSPGRPIEVRSALTLDDENFLVYAGSGTPIRKTIRYHLPDAVRVRIDWGLDGWHLPPPQMRPSGSTVEFGVVTAPMVRRDGYFTADLVVPAESTLDFGFLITRKRGLLERVLSPKLEHGSYRRALGRLLIPIFRADVQPVYINGQANHVNAVGPELVEVWPNLQLGDEAALGHIPKRYWALAAAVTAAVFVTMTFMLKWCARRQGTPLAASQN